MAKKKNQATQEETQEVVSDQTPLVSEEILFTEEVTPVVPVANELVEPQPILPKEELPVAVEAKPVVELAKPVKFVGNTVVRGKTTFVFD